jgi:hypothetical protein
VIVEGCRVVVRVAGCNVGEIIAEPGTVWRPHCPVPAVPESETCHGGYKAGEEWIITERRGAVRFAVAAGEQRRMTLSFTTPAALQPGTSPIVRIFQRTSDESSPGLSASSCESGTAPGHPRASGRAVVNDSPQSRASDRLPEARRGKWNHYPGAWLLLGPRQRLRRAPLYTPRDRSRTGSHAAVPGRANVPARV